MRSRLQQGHIDASRCARPRRCRLDFQRLLLRTLACTEVRVTLSLAALAGPGHPPCLRHAGSVRRILHKLVSKKIGWGGSLDGVSVRDLPTGAAFREALSGS